MSGRLGPYGRPNSFGRDTSGHKGWMAVNYFEGKNADGSPRMSQGFKNILTNQEIRPAAGHNAEPPGRTGEIIRHSTDAFRENYDKIRWDK